MPQELTHALLVVGVVLVVGFIGVVASDYVDDRRFMKQFQRDFPKRPRTEMDVYIDMRVRKIRAMDQMRRTARSRHEH